MLLLFISKNSPADRNLGSHLDADTPLHSNPAGQDAGVFSTAFELSGPRDSHDRNDTDSFQPRYSDHPVTHLHRDDDIIDSVPVDDVTATPKAVQESEAALPSHNAKSNLPPWLRTQSTNGPTSQSASVAINALAPSIQKQGQETSTYPSLSSTQRARQEQSLPATHISYDESASSSAPASGQARGPSTNLTTLAAPGPIPNATSSHLFLPAMAQCSTLPIMTGGPLVPNSQPNSSFVLTSSGPMLSSAAQRLFPPGTGLLGGNMAQDFQMFNNQGILHEVVIFFSYLLLSFTCTSLSL